MLPCHFFKHLWSWSSLLYPLALHPSSHGNPTPCHSPFPLQYLWCVLLPPSRSFFPLPTNGPFLVFWVLRILQTKHKSKI